MKIKVIHWGLSPTLVKKCILLSLAILFGFKIILNAQQSDNLVRVYASRAEASSSLLGSVSLKANAVDGDPETPASINSVILGSPKLFLDFGVSSSSGSIDGNRPITIKLSLPGGVLNAVGGVTVQAIKNLRTNLAGWTATNVGSPVTKSSILGLLSGNGSFYITLKPGASYDGVAISMNGVNVITSMNVYEAFILDTVGNTVSCNEAIDVLSGVGANVSLATLTSNVLDPYNAIDADTSTYTSLLTGVQLLSKAYLTTVFTQPSQVGDSLSIILKNPGGLLNLAALNGFKIQPYLNDSALTPIDNSGNLIRLRLLYSGSDKQILTVPISESFNRMEISLGGVANALDHIDIYDVNRIIPKPIIESSDQELYVYLGQSITLSAQTLNADSIIWYSDSLGGTALPSNLLLTNNLSAETKLSFYAEAMRIGCTEVSERNKTDVYVLNYNNNLPDSIGFENFSYNDNVTVTIPNASILPYSPQLLYTLDSGVLPPGITLDSLTGELNGIPNTIGTYPFNIKVFDSANNMKVGIFNYSITINNSSLSVNWDYFEVMLGSNNTAFLKWRTTSEINNSGFYIERSVDGKIWHEMGFVKSQATEGFSKIALNYHFIDKDPISGSNFYRLKQVDIDGRFKYSKVRELDLTNSINISVFPNPTYDMVTIKGLEKCYQLKIYDGFGRCLLTQQNEPLNSETKVSFKDLAPGQYILSIQLLNGEFRTFKVNVL